MRQKVCAYVGNRYLKEYREHMKEIADHGFNAILHPFNEQDVMFNNGIIERLIFETKNAGFICWADPHGLGNNFGYGSISQSKNEAYPLSISFVNLMEKWVNLIKDTDYILWDEPKLTVNLNDKVPMYHYLDNITAITHDMGIRNSICLWGSPGHRNVERINRFQEMKYMDDIGVSLTVDGMFFEEYIKEWIFTLSDVDCSTSIWIPGYEIPEGKEQDIQNVVDLVSNSSVLVIGHWAFRGSEAMPYKSDRPGVVWKVAGDAFNGIVL